jgi:divalent metal cation (Fe/Co/Zn/Cd) transporter
VSQAQQASNRRKERAALWSIAASAGITLAKGAAGISTGSLALISDAAHSLLDVASTTMTWLAVRAAHKPADDEHQYGHGKVESLAALVQTAFLFLLSGVVAYEGLRRLASGETEVVPNAVAVAVLAGSIGVDAWRWRSLKTVARETGSEALDADALHFSADLVNSALVLAALAAAALGYPQVDSLVAVGGLALPRARGLPSGPAHHRHAPRRRAERACGADSRAGCGGAGRGVGRARPGPQRGRAGVRGGDGPGPAHPAAGEGRRHQGAHRRGRAAGGARAEITVATEPVQLDDETVLERILLIAAKRRVPVHHIMVQEVAGRLSVSLDFEIDGRMSLGAAHALATKLETAIRDEFGEEIEVDTHIEPLRVGALAGEDESREVSARIGGWLSDTAARIGAVQDIHSVRVRRTDDGLVVHYHCRFDPALTVAAMHERVDELERRFRAEHPEVVRVIGHAEPLNGHA